METALLVACSRAITILTNGFVPAISALVLIGSVIASMATGAIRLIRWELPGNYFSIALVTFCARKVAAMILRFVRQCCVPVVGRCPSIRGMTYVALNRGAEMILILAGRLNTVMAGRTRTENLRMVDCQHGREYVCRVTVFANISGLRVRRILARCICTVMTADAIAGDVDVIEIRR